ncbi:hypothetical protein [Paracoccus sp. ME4]|uniref:DUF5983 family protein n=1 Tax=Paracoccus sp. ME4 TaxID=3138066 RepID=UPI00398BA266
MEKTNDLGIEEARIITISTAHLSPFTRDYINEMSGNLHNGPSIAIRDDGFLVNSYHGSPNALDQHMTATGHRASLYDRAPDLVLIMALARGVGAEWINMDVDGVEYSDILPTYDDDETVSIPTGSGWSDALNRIGTNNSGQSMVVPTREILEIIEAGQTPGLYVDEMPEP